MFVLKRLGISCICAILLAACGSSHSAKASTSQSVTSTTDLGSTTTSSTATSTTQPGVAPAVGRQTYVRTVATPALGVSVTYPELGGMASGSIEGNINAAILGAVKGYVKAFETQLGERSSGSSAQGGGPTQSQMDGSFTTEFIDSRYASFKFQLTEFAVGAATNSIIYPTLTFDLSSGRSLSLSDLFTDSNYLSKLSSLSKVQLDSKLGSNANQNLVTNGTQPSSSNFADWNMKSSGLEITFPGGQVAAVASGGTSIVIPYSDLKSIAKTGGPISQP